jgi:hypothetical protein
MSIGFVFWLLMLLWLFQWLWGRPWTAGGYGWGGDLLMFALFFLLGWKAFGFMIHA